MNKKFLAIVILFFTMFSLFAEKPETNPTEEQQGIIDKYGDDLDKFYELSDSDLDTFINFGDKDQKKMAEWVREYRKRRDELLRDIQRLNNLKDNIPEGLPETYSATNGIQDQIDQKIEELREENEKRDRDRKRAQEISEQRKAAKDSQKKGDPVKITRGSYEQNETDFTIGTVISFSINRQYDSESTIYSGFGYGWSTNLDERIILGIDPDAESVYKASTKLVNNLVKNITEQENGILKTYEVSSIENGAKEIREQFQTIIDGFKSVEAKAQNYSFPDFASEARSSISKLESQRNSLLNKFNEDVRILENLRKQLAEEIPVNEVNKKRYEKTCTRKSANSKVMFRGMDRSFEEIGLEQITVIDEGGYPHILTETGEDSLVWKKDGDRSIGTCRRLSDGKYEIPLSDGTVKLYDSNGLLIKITDRNSNYVFVDRTTEGRINYVENSFGEKLVFTYDGSYIKTIVNAKNNTDKTEYTYENGKLKAVKDSDGDTVVMNYNQDSQLESLVKTDGSSIQYIYGEESQDNRKLITSTLDEEGFAEYFSYYSDHTVYTDHDGNVTITYFYPDQKTKQEKNQTAAVSIMNIMQTER